MNCTISGNTTDPYYDGSGGGVLGTGTFTNCTISGNSACKGGGVYCSSSSIFNSTIIAFSEGEGIYFSNAGESQIEYCDIFGSSGGDIAFKDGNPVHGPAGIGELINTNANGDSCDIFYNIFLDPMFVDTSANDFNLIDNSPCIDAGDSSLTLDPDCTIADIGAFYFDQTNLLVDPDCIGFGLLDLGTDSATIISLTDPSSLPIPIDTIFHSIPDFIIDTTGLNGQINPQETDTITVTFSPSAAGTYIDTLVIVAQQVGDDTIRIPLSGEADVIPIPVDSLVIERGPLNGIQLFWEPVTRTISGQPVNADYVVYGAISPDGPFIPFGYALDTTYVHPYILNSQSIYFYYVTAIPEGALPADKIESLIQSRSFKIRR